MRPKGAPEQVLVHDFLIPDLAGSVLMGCTISPRTRPGSVWGRTNTAFAVEKAGGAAFYPSRLHNGTRAAAMGIGSACGSWSCRNWRMRRALKSTCATSHQGPASGTRSNTACSPRSVRTGAESRWQRVSDMNVMHRQGKQPHRRAFPSHHLCSVENMAPRVSRMRTARSPIGG